MFEHISRRFSALAAVLLVAFGCVFVATPAFAEDLEPGSAQFESADAPMGAQAEGDAQLSPVFRLYNQYSGQHLYTLSASERNGLVPLGWNYEGVGWQSLSEGNPVYRVYNPNSGEHFYTMSSAEKANLVKLGWRDEGTAWGSGLSSDASLIPVYRQYNPNSGLHNYTVSEEENASLVKEGWRAEGVAWYEAAADPSYQDEMAVDTGVINTWPDDGSVTYDPVYRLYLPSSGDHFYTASKGERNSVGEGVWRYEGATWQVPSAGTPVYRVFNPNSGEHFYTANPKESSRLVYAGWSYEGVAWYACPEADASRVPVYRVYNPNSGLHMYTMSDDERKKLVSVGWRDEGVAWHESALASDFEDDVDAWELSFSGDDELDSLLKPILFFHKSLRSVFDYAASFSYIRGSEHAGSSHFLADSMTSSFAKEMVRNGGGNCYRFASLFSWLARGLGYSTNVVSGWVPSYSAGQAPHGWTEVYVDGATYICDPDNVQFYPSVNWYMRTYADPPTNYGSW